MYKYVCYGGSCWLHGNFYTVEGEILALGSWSFTDSSTLCPYVDDLSVGNRSCVSQHSLVESIAIQCTITRISHKLIKRGVGLCRIIIWSFWCLRTVPWNILFHYSLVGSCVLWHCLEEWAVAKSRKASKILRLATHYPVLTFELFQWTENWLYSDVTIGALNYTVGCIIPRVRHMNLSVVSWTRCC